MSEFDHQREIRIAKRDALRALGVDPYPRRAPFDCEPELLHQRFGERSAEELAALGSELRVPGRVRALRPPGKLAYIDLADGRGSVQLFLRRGELEQAGWELFEQLDLGDLVLARGTVMRTRAGELSVLVRELVLLAKALRPLPEKWHGLTDKEARYRQRYLDLIVNPESRRTFERRAAIIDYLRGFLNARSYLEVETPMMQPIPGGAAARPFSTHHNALDLELYLRVAPELYLKRLLVGGLHRVYEINRNFRNEGLSTQHNPEFTMLEFYQAYSDYEQLMTMTEEMLSGLAQHLLGGTRLRFRERELELALPWPRLPMVEALQSIGGIPAAALRDVSSLRAELAGRGLEPPPAAESYGHLVLHLFEEVVEPALWSPTFIIDHPVEVSPFAKACGHDPRFTERFELYLGGFEVANAFTELNDPAVQLSRFEDQLRLREGGDEEAHRIDRDYVAALEYGMPPAGGEGIGIDRLVMVFCDQSSIRDVILFPLLKPRAARSNEHAASPDDPGDPDDSGGPEADDRRERGTDGAT